MARIKIKQLDERIATSGVHFGGPPERRKLHPGEVVEMDENSELFKGIWATGKVEITPEPATRPLDYASPREAQLTAPTYKPRDPSDALEMDNARTAVADRMANVSTAPPVADSPAEESEPESEPAAKPNRRAARRAALKAATDGQKATA